MSCCVYRTCRVNSLPTPTSCYINDQEVNTVPRRQPFPKMMPIILYRHTCSIYTYFTFISCDKVKFFWEFLHTVFVSPHSRMEHLTGNRRGHTNDTTTVVSLNFTGSNFHFFQQNSSAENFTTFNFERVLIMCRQILRLKASSWNLQKFKPMALWSILFLPWYKHPWTL